MIQAATESSFFKKGMVSHKNAFLKTDTMPNI